MIKRPSRVGEGAETLDAEIAETGKTFPEIVRRIQSLVITVGGSLQRTLRRDKPTQTGEMPTLSENVRYALRYNEGQFGAEEVVSTLEFGGLGVYLALKLFMHNPELEMEMLKKILPALSTDDNYRATKNLLRQFIPEHSQDAGKINGVKTAQVMRQGTELFETGFNNLADKIKQAGEIPVLLAYAGLIGLGPFTKKMEESGQLIIINPYIIKQGGLSGYYIQRFGDELSVERLKEDHFQQNDRKFALADNSVKSGETFELVKKCIESMGAQVGIIEAVTAYRRPGNTDKITGVPASR